MLKISYYTKKAGNSIIIGVPAYFFVIFLFLKVAVCYLAVYVFQHDLSAFSVGCLWDVVHSAEAQQCVNIWLMGLGC